MIDGTIIYNEGHCGPEEYLRFTSADLRALKTALNAIPHAGCDCCAPRFRGEDTARPGRILKAELATDGKLYGFYACRHGRQVCEFCGTGRPTELGPEVEDLGDFEL